jgi:hypothetical protein
VAEDRTLAAAGPTSIDGDGGVGPSDVDVGTYNLSEEGGPNGYEAGSWSCTGDGGQEGSSISLTEGENVVCTINNDDIPPELIIVKQVLGLPDGGFCLVVSGAERNQEFCILTSGGIGEDVGPEDKGVTIWHH